MVGEIRTLFNDSSNGAPKADRERWLVLEPMHAHTHARMCVCACVDSLSKMFE